MRHAEILVAKLPALVAVAAASLAAPWLAAANQNPELEFEAASVRSASGESSGGVTVHFLSGGPGTSTPGLFQCMNCSLWSLVMKAYDVERHQVSGPGLLDRELMIRAKVPSGATKEQFLKMLQNLLAERMKLALHKEHRQVDGYALVVGTNGPKLKESSSVEDASPGSRLKVTLDEDRFVIIPPGQPTSGVRTYRNGNLFSMGTGRGSMEQLARELTRALRCPVVDSTGLNGNYQFVLYWALELSVPAADSGAALPVASTPLPTLAAALQKLGLKMERRTVSTDLLVIDHLEKTPTEN
jgi:uncharacterized protein (TIGR03435 family)